jgi:hypothetical protein
MSILSLESVGNYPPLLISYPPPNKSTIDEVSDFKHTLFRNSDETIVENKCRELIKKYTEKSDWESLYFLFCVIRETREYRQERLLTYIQLYVWYEIHPLWATSALTDCIYSYGSWKDIKYFCEYCKNKSLKMDHPFILFSLCILDRQLKEDWKHYQSGYPPCEISYASKWTPREKSKHGWIYTMLCAGYFDYMKGAITIKQNEKALNKSKMTLRKILATLNKYLDTLEIKMSGNYWDYINPHTIPIHSAFKYHKAFFRHGVNVFTKIFQQNKIPYPYSNIKNIADRLNHVLDLDKEIDTSSKKTVNYMKHFNNIILDLFGNKTHNYLSIIDISTLNQYDINTAIGFTCIECSGSMIITPNGKNIFFNFSSSTLKNNSFCEKVQELSTFIKPFTFLDKNITENTSIFIKKTCQFMENCFKETDISDNEKIIIKFTLFSRQHINVLNEICKNEIFELSRDLYPISI